MIWALEAARPSMTPLRQRPAFITVGLATEEETGRHLDEIAQAGPGELLSRPVDQDLLGGCGWGVLAGSFDELAVDEGRAGADQGDEVRRVDCAPAVLG